MRTFSSLIPPRSNERFQRLRFSSLSLSPLSLSSFSLWPVLWLLSSSWKKILSLERKSFFALKLLMRWVWRQKMNVLSLSQVKWWGRKINDGETKRQSWNGNEWEEDAKRKRKRILTSISIFLFFLRKKNQVEERCIYLTLNWWGMFSWHECE